ncbi:MAG TPA: tRNA pseudouridine(38-40) synthase TruA, partial [Acidimicrobiales bacterium]|nr:tRNA pseudouridine(38-40) synthase TruA [Acidimicrobiales bacterium]
MSGRLFEPDETGAAPRGPLRRVMALVAYDGTGFHGFAPQPNQAVRTVGGVLAAALGKMAGCEIEITCAGRTDAGVHARGQVVHADLPAPLVERWLALEPASPPQALARLARSLTAQCGPAISVRWAGLAPKGFDARHSATARRYRYEILRTPAPDPLARFSTWHVPGELELAAMRIAADAFLGEHDFAAFCRRPPGHEGALNRRVVDARLRLGECGRRLVLEIEANAFCHQMVRSVVGALVAVGQGRITAADVHALLRSGSRSGAPQPAPPQGLCLVLVRYPEDLVPGGVVP